MRGVEDLITVKNEQPQASVKVEKIRVNQNQPRRWFDPEKMAQLVESVRSYGILEPLLVRPLPADGKSFPLNIYNYSRAFRYSDT